MILQYNKDQTNKKSKISVDYQSPSVVLEFVAFRMQVLYLLLSFLSHLFLKVWFRDSIEECRETLFDSGIVIFRPPFFPRQYPGHQLSQLGS